MKRKIKLLITTITIVQLALAQTTPKWGDQLNNTYINPVVNADYSDPDVIRIGKHFLLVNSEFHFMGITLLHSYDLVNWRIVSRLYDRLDAHPDYDTNKRYAGGSWAPSIRLHDDKLFVFFCTPHEGLFMTSAKIPDEILKEVQGDTLIGDSSLYAQNDEDEHFTVQQGTVTHCAFGGGSSLRKDDGNEHSTMRQKAARYGEEDTLIGDSSLYAQNDGEGHSTMRQKAAQLWGKLQWDTLTHVAKVEKWEDPCPLWDTDGNAYLARSQHGAGPIYIHKMTTDGKKLLDDGKIVYTGPVAEGPKLHKINQYYYISIPEGGVETGWQTILKATNIYGPYQKKVALEQGSTNINGPHQGALVDTHNGEWWFIHFQSKLNIGRVTHLQPVRWIDHWPVIGVDLDMNGIGEPVTVWTKPDVGITFASLTSLPLRAEIPDQVRYDGERHTTMQQKAATQITQAPYTPQTTDDFNTTQLALQWAWNHNPVNDNWSLTTNAGFLTLHALKADSFPLAKNTITQKVMGNKGTATTLLVAEQLQNGQLAGLALMGKYYHLIGLTKVDNINKLFTNINGKITYYPINNVNKIFLQVDVSTQNNGNQFRYSTDNITYHTIKETFNAGNGHWKGPKIALFNYNTINNSGIAMFDWFTYTHDGNNNKY